MCPQFCPFVDQPILVNNPFGAYFNLFQGRMLSVFTWHPGPLDGRAEAGVKSA